MAFSFVNYTGDGTNRVFNVPFNYISRSHVRATVNGVNRSFTWLSPSSIQLSSAPANGAEVQVRRRTPSTTPLVNFTDGSTITEKDLDTLAYQSVFLAQEAIDIGEELGEDLAEAGATILAAAQAAQADANEAVALAAAAQASASAAEAAVTAGAGQVATDKAAAEAAATAAADSASAASGSALNAASSAADANAARIAAEGHADDAAASAAAAALAAGFDPDDFYTKAQIDSNRTTWLFEQSQIVGLATALDGKANASHTHIIANISGLQTALDAKLGVTANAASASRWATARSLTLAGNATGSVSFDGSANATLTVTVVANSHNHTIANVTGLQAALDDKAGVSQATTVGTADFPIGTILLVARNGNSVNRNALAKIDFATGNLAYQLSVANDPDVNGTWRSRGSVGTAADGYTLCQRVS